MVSYYSVVEHRMPSSVWFARELLTILDDEMMQIYVTDCQALMLKTRVAGQCALYSRRSFALMLVLGSDYWDRITLENVELGLINIIIVSIIVMSSYTEYSKPSHESSTQYSLRIGSGELSYNKKTAAPPQ